MRLSVLRMATKYYYAKSLQTMFVILLLNIFLKDHLDDCLKMIKRDDVIIDYITVAIAKVITDRSFPMADKNKEDG